jgi:hypothetical protein
MCVERENVRDCCLYEEADFSLVHLLIHASSIIFQFRTLEALEILQ